MDGPLRLPPPRPADAEVLIHAGGSVDSCSVCLRVFGDDLDPDSVSAMLQAQPSKACRKGDIFRGKKYDRVEKTGKWLLKIEHQRGADLDNVLNRLLDAVTSDLATWANLHGRFEVDLFCGLQMELWNRGLTLSPSTLKRVADRNLHLGFDMYFVGDDSDSGQQ